MPEVLITMGLIGKSTPLKERLAEGQRKETGIVPPGELTNIGVFIATRGRL
jgi:hypothetical protein